MCFEDLKILKLVAFAARDVEEAADTMQLQQVT